MDFHQWQKVVYLLHECPKLEAQVPRQEANRLFYACFRYNMQANRTIGCREFMKLLLEFASAGGVHPLLVFKTIKTKNSSGVTSEGQVNSPSRRVTSPSRRVNSPSRRVSSLSRRLQYNFTSSHDSTSQLLIKT
mmetsp:Transcript_66446/g.122762  ORF Transcript_66446/g.122762 Transcript_66446/m.122762 type:complete len:134 (+) Transcript_66446:2-403(+)